MWPGKAELVGCHEVGGVDVAKLEPRRADVTSVSALLLWFAVVLRLWFRRFDSGLFSESRGEDELELERRWLEHEFVYMFVMLALSSPSMCSMTSCLSSYRTRPDLTRLSNFDIIDNSSISNLC